MIVKNYADIKMNNKHYPEEWTDINGDKQLTCVCGNKLPCIFEEKIKQQFVLGFIFDKTLNNILLCKKNPLNKSPELTVVLKNKLNGIGGGVELNDLGVFELPSLAMSRETREETGLNIENWTKFAKLEAEFGIIYCFYTVTDDIYNFQQIEHEELKIYDIVDNRGLGYGFYQNERRMANIDYLIIMALNHYKKLDSVEYFEITEK